MEDLEIISLVRKGNVEAFAEIVRRYQGRVQGLCVSVLLDASEAEDAAQEVFLKVFTSLGAYREDASFGAWIYRVTTNHCLDLLRKRKRRKTDSLDQMMEPVDGLSGGFEPRASSEDDPGSEHNAGRALARGLLSTLTPDERALLVLREVEGLRYDEIADVLKCSVEAVRARLHRARNRLQEKARHVLGTQTSDK